MKYCIAAERLPILSRSLSINEIAFNLRGEQERYSGFRTDARRAFLSCIGQVGKGGLEPPCLAAHDPKSCSSASSDTSPPWSPHTHLPRCRAGRISRAYVGQFYHERARGTGQLSRLAGRQRPPATWYHHSSAPRSFGIHRPVVRKETREPAV